MFSFDRHTIFVTLAGSQAHGTSRAGSDVDLRGVCIAPLAVRLSLFGSFEQHDGPLPDELVPLVLPEIEGDDTHTECVLFDIAKFARLCSAANPNALEILFADEGDWLLETSAWRRFYGERHQFLTRKVQQTFLGYAMSQLKRIRTHRSWLLHPPSRKPAREDFGLPASRGVLSRDDQHRIEQSIADTMRRYGVEDIEMPGSTRIAVNERMEAFHRDLLAVSDEDLEARMRAVASDALSLPVDVISGLNAERKYRAAMKHWESYQTWQNQRNRSRAALERDHGYDTKHAMHLIRLMRMGLEVLERGELRVRRDDAAELSAIRDGQLSFDELLEAAGALRSQMESAVATTSLPTDVDRERVDALVLEIISDLRSS